MTTVINGYEADPDHVAAIVAEEIDAEDRSDPTLLYLRAAQVRALHTAVAREMTLLCAEACLQLHQDGLSYQAIADLLGLTKPNVQKLIDQAKAGQAHG